MEKLKLDDFKDYKFLSQLQLSPNGINTAVIAKKANGDNGYNAVIYVNKGDGFYRLTNEKGNAGFYIWLDDETILFSELRCPKKKEQVKNGYEWSSFYKINISGGEAVEAFSIEAKATAIRLIGDGTYLIQTLFDNSRPDLSGKSPEEAEKLLAEYKKEQDYQVVDEIPYWFNGKGFTNKTRNRLYIYEQENGLKPVTEALEEADSFKLSPCKKYIAYAVNNFKDGVKEVKESLYLLNLETGERKDILQGEYYLKGYDFYKDSMVVSMSEGKTYKFHEHPEFYIVNLKDGSKKEIYKSDLSIGTGPGSDCRLGGGTAFKVYGDDLYFTALHRFYGHLNKLSLSDGKCEILSPEKGSIDMFDVNQNGIVTVAMCDGRLQEVYELQNKELTLLSGFNEDIHKNKIYSKPQYIPFTNKDGIEIDGWAILPVGYDENKKYPAILNIHGGPKAAFGDVYFHEMQYWAAEGYFVFFSNPRGGDGRGNEFAEIRGKYGTIDYEDLMAFADWAIEKYPSVDTNNFGVTGGSYGGFMTNWIVGHTDRFKAAASQRSIANWISFSNICDIGYYFGPDQLQADTWSSQEVLWDKSPLKYADKVKTPILFIHSDEDYRCWIQEAYQMFTAVKLHGADTRLCIFHGENHELSRSGKPLHRERRLKEITEWMNKYLKA